MMSYVDVVQPISLHRNERLAILVSALIVVIEVGVNMERNVFETTVAVVAAFDNS
jgi:hypothetical protein